jgi:hypothetical protein
MSENLEIDIVDIISMLIEQGFIKKSDSYEKITNIVKTRSKENLDLTSISTSDIESIMKKGTYKQIIDKVVKDNSDKKPSKEDIEIQSQLTNKFNNQFQLKILLTSLYKKGKFTLDQTRGEIYNMIKSDAKDLGFDKKETKNIIFSWHDELISDEEETLSKYNIEITKDQGETISSEEMDEEKLEKISKLREMADIEMRLRYSGMGSLTEKEKKAYKEYTDEKKLRYKQKEAKDILAEKSKEKVEKKPEPIIAKQEEIMTSRFPSRSTSVKRLVPKTMERIMKENQERLERIRIERQEELERKERKKQKLESEEDIDISVPSDEKKIIRKKMKIYPKKYTTSVKEEEKKEEDEEIPSIKVDAVYFYTDDEIENNNVFGYVISDLFLQSLFCFEKENQVDLLKLPEVAPEVKKLLAYIISYNDETVIRSMIRSINNLIYDKTQQDYVKKPSSVKIYKGQVTNYNREILYKRQFINITENNIQNSSCNLPFYEYYLSLLDLIESRRYSNMPFYTYEKILYNMDEDENEIIRKDKEVVFEKVNEKDIEENEKLSKELSSKNVVTELEKYKKKILKEKNYEEYLLTQDEIINKRIFEVAISDSFLLSLLCLNSSKLSFIKTDKKIIELIKNLFQDILTGNENSISANINFIRSQAKLVQGEKYTKPSTSQSLIIYPPDDMREKLYKTLFVSINNREPKRCDESFLKLFNNIMENINQKEDKLLYNHEKTLLEYNPSVLIIEEELEQEQKEVLPEEELIQILTSRGSFYVWRGLIDEKAIKEKDFEEKKKRLSSLRLSGELSLRQPSDIIARKNQNLKGYRYVIWLSNNLEATEKEHLEKLNFLRFMPTSFNQFMTLSKDEKELFSSIIIKKYEDEIDMEYNTWDFNEEMTRFIREYKNNKLKLRTALTDLEKQYVSVNALSDLYGDDQEDLLREIKDEDIDNEDVIDDDLERIQDNVANEQDNINNLMAEFFQENIIDKQGETIKMNNLIKKFLAWLYKAYPSSPNFLTGLIVDSVVNAVGKKNITIVKLNERDSYLNIKNKSFAKKFSDKDDEELIQARSFINLATTYDVKSKLYILFHMAAYKASNVDEFFDKVEYYNEKLVEMTGEKFPEEFIKKYVELWKINQNKNMVERLMAITPFVRSYLKQSTRILKNPLIQDPSRRKNRLRQLNSIETVTDKFLARLPNSISQTTKECLLWHQTKPWWNLDFRRDSVIISNHDGQNKLNMADDVAQYFGEFVNTYKINGKDHHFYKPSRIYNLLLCHLNYNQKDLVQCNPQDDNSITLSTPSQTIRIYTGIYTVPDIISPYSAQPILDEDEVSKTRPSRETFRLVIKDMYNKECEWWKTKMYSSKVIMNNLKKMMMSEETRLTTFIIETFQNLAEIILRDFYKNETRSIDFVGIQSNDGNVNMIDQKVDSSIIQKQVSNIEKYAPILSKYIINYLLSNKNISVSKFAVNFMFSLSPLQSSFYPSKVLYFYKNLWNMLDITRTTQEDIFNIMSIPNEYKYLELYTHPDLGKRESLLKILVDEIAKETDFILIKIHNSFYTTRSHIKYYRGRKLGDVDDIKIGKIIKEYEIKPLDKCPEKFIYVRASMLNDDFEEVEKVICMDVMNIYDLHRLNYREEYYETRYKVDGEFVDVKIPSGVVNLIYKLVREQLNKSSASYNFNSGDQENIEHDDVYVMCKQCNKLINSNDRIYKSYEQIKDNGKIRNEFVVYCSSNCFNKVEEKLPEITEDTKFENIGDNTSSDLMSRAHINLMLKILRETDIDLPVDNYNSKYEIERDINKGIISNKKFKKIMGEEIIEKYTSMIYYLGF